MLRRSGSVAASFLFFAWTHLRSLHVQLPAVAQVDARPVHALLIGPARALAVGVEAGLRGLEDASAVGTEKLTTVAAAADALGADQGGAGDIASTDHAACTAVGVVRLEVGAFGVAARLTRWAYAVPVDARATANAAASTAVVRVLTEIAAPAPATIRELGRALVRRAARVAVNALADVDAIGRGRTGPPRATFSGVAARSRATAAEASLARALCSARARLPNGDRVLACTRRDDDDDERERAQETGGRESRSRRCHVSRESQTRAHASA